MSTGLALKYEDEATSKGEQRDASERCPECDGPVVVETTESVCQDCGLVVEEHPLDHGPEWRVFGTGEANERRRVGPPVTAIMHDGGLSTEIGYTDGEESPRLRRLRRHHGRCKFQSKRERNRALAYSELRRMAGALGVDHPTLEQACRLFDETQDAGLCTGRSLEAIASAVLYARVRIQHRAVTLAEIVEVSRVDESSIRNALRVMNRELELPMPPPLAAERVPRILSAFGLNGSIRRRALELARLADESTAVNCNPDGVAAAAVYLASRRTITQERLADAADVTAMTIRSRMEDLQELMDA